MKKNLYGKMAILMAVPLLVGAAVVFYGDWKAALVTAVMGLGLSFGAVSKLSFCRGLESCWIAVLASPVLLGVDIRCSLRLTGVLGVGIFDAVVWTVQLVMILFSLELVILLTVSRVVWNKQKI